MHLDPKQAAFIAGQQALGHKNTKDVSSPQAALKYYGHWHATKGVHTLPCCHHAVKRYTVVGRYIPQGQQTAYCFMFSTFLDHKYKCKRYVVYVAVVIEAARGYKFLSQVNILHLRISDQTNRFAKYFLAGYFSFCKKLDEYALL